MIKIADHKNSQAMNTGSESEAEWLFSGRVLPGGAFVGCYRVLDGAGRGVPLGARRRGSEAGDDGERVGDGAAVDADGDEGRGGQLALLDEGAGALDDGGVGGAAGHEVGDEGAEDRLRVDPAKQLGGGARRDGEDAGADPGQRKAPPGQVTGWGRLASGRRQMVASGVGAVTRAASVGRQQATWTGAVDVRASGKWVE